MTQAKMKRLINNKEISFQKFTDNHHTPYTAKYGKQGTVGSKPHHVHHHSVALNSPQYQHAVSSSTGTTRELKTVSSRVPKITKKSKYQANKNKPSPINSKKELMNSNMSEKMSMTESGHIIGYITPSMKYDSESSKYQTINDVLSSQKDSRHIKTASASSYNQSKEAYSNKQKSSNPFHQKPTYIILTIDSSGDKGNVKKRETPKTSMNTITTASYAKQGQSYQQLSSLKKFSKKKATHTRVKSDHILKSKPAINFLAYKKSNASGFKKKGSKASAKHSKNLQIVKTEMYGKKPNYVINKPSDLTGPKLRKQMSNPNLQKKDKKKGDSKNFLGKATVTKHKRVRSDVNAASNVMFHENFGST